MFALLYLFLIVILGCSIGSYLLVMDTELNNKKKVGVILPFVIFIMNIYCFIQISKISIGQSIIFFIYSITQYPLSVRLCIDILLENQAYNRAADKLHLSKHPPIRSLFTIYEIIMVEEQEYSVKR